MVLIQFDNVSIRLSDDTADKYVDPIRNMVFYFLNHAHTCGNPTVVRIRELCENCGISDLDTMKKLMRSCFIDVDYLISNRTCEGSSINLVFSAIENESNETLKIHFDPFLIPFISKTTS